MSISFLPRTQGLYQLSFCFFIAGKYNPPFYQHNLYNFTWVEIQKYYIVKLIPDSSCDEYVFVSIQMFNYPSKQNFSIRNKVIIYEEKKKTLYLVYLRLLDSTQYSISSQTYIDKLKTQISQPQLIDIAKFRNNGKHLSFSVAKLIIDEFLKKILKKQKRNASCIIDLFRCRQQFKMSS